METSVISWSNIHEHGPLWFKHHCLRKQLFVDEMLWDIPHNDRAEWDQYDTASTLYVITHDTGRVLAASRLNRCNHNSGGWSYMIRDAALGKLQDIPSGLIDSAPIGCSTFEATRFTTDPNLDAETRNSALQENATQLARTAVLHGATTLIALMSPAFVRWLRKAGLKANRIGPIVKTGDGNRVCVIGADLTERIDLAAQ